MAEKGLISIIIPVYNSQDRLAECLDSIVAQSYRPIEVIIVDDCSTDGSLEICREYERRYAYVHVYTKVNEGVSAARNFGMSKARGEYLQFVDSDDRMAPDACRFFVDCIERDRSDLVIGGYLNEKEQREICYPARTFEGREAFLQEFPQLFGGFFLHVPWNKLYRNRAFEAEFPEHFNKGEDLIFNLQVMAQVDRISVMDKAVYVYHNTEETSLSSRFRDDAMEIEEQLYQAVAEFYTKYGGKEIQFLYQFYLDAFKNKCYALTGQSGYDRRRCCDILRRWINKESIRRLCRQRGIFGRKDRVLLVLIKCRCAFFLYVYYKKLAGRK